MKMTRQPKTKLASKPSTKPINRSTNKPTLRFSVKLTEPEINQRNGSNQSSSATVLILPKNIGSKLPAENKVAVEGVINNFPFRVNFDQNKQGDYELIISEAMYKSARIVPSELVNIEITRIGDEVETRIPADISKALAATPKAKTTWEDTTTIARRDWIFWMITGKREETRKSRIESGCDMLAHGKRRVCCFPGIEWMMKNG